MSSLEQTEATTQLTVALADLAVTRDPGAMLCSCPLGACLGVVIFDPISKVGGLLHSLLPSSSIDPTRAASRPGMFLDTGITALLKSAKDLGAKMDNIQVFVAGGSQIMDESTAFNIGTRNYNSLTEVLAKLGLKIYAEDVGGMTNRSMQLNMATGDVRIKYSGQARMKSLCKPSTTT